MKKIVIPGSITLILIVLVIWKLAGNKKELDTRAKRSDSAAVAIPVKVFQVWSDTIRTTIQKTGNILAFKEAKVLSTKSAVLRNTYFVLGSRVGAGELLALTDNSAALIDFQKARQNVAKLSNDLDTYRELFEGKAATAQKLKDLQQQYNDALSQEEMARKDIQDAHIMAPISGMIYTKDVEAGVFLNAGAQIATIVNTEKVRVQVNLSENEVYHVRKGQSVKIYASVYPGHEFMGILSYISPRADESHNYMVEVIMNNTGDLTLHPGTFVRTDFLDTTVREAMLVPREAVSGGPDDATVFLVVDKQVKLRKIKTGQRPDGWMEVIAGLVPGDQVVVSGQINLKDGSLISVSK